MNTSATATPQTATASSAATAVGALPAPTSRRPPRSGLPRLLGAALLAGLLAACGSNSVRLDPLPPVENRGGAPAGAASAPVAQTLPTAQSRVATVDLGARSGAGANGSTLAPGANDGAMGANGADGRVIYFDFDSFAVREEFKPLIAGQARTLAANRSRRLLLEGHTDARGGSEYNLALGQKRAEAVVRALALLGVQDNQVEAVSFGKERPATPGNDEAAFAKNRRVEMKDR